MSIIAWETCTQPPHPRDAPSATTLFVWISSQQLVGFALSGASLVAMYRGKRSDRFAFC